MLRQLYEPAHRHMETCGNHLEQDKDDESKALAHPHHHLGHLGTKPIP
jgi:hypothetical protein